MYEDYFGLVEPPFDLGTDPRFLYLSPSHARAKAYLDYAVYKGDGLVVITGEIGVGKSLLIHELAEREHARADITLIRQPQPALVDFLQGLLLQWDCAQPPATPAELVAAAHHELTERFVWGHRTTLVIDEAQTLSRELLETLRMLADTQIGPHKPLAIVLVGQPCLREKLAGAEMEQFRQRVRLSFHLSALDQDEIRQYIEKRLDVAGASPGPWPIFRHDTIAVIHRYTGGVPRLINVLADLALTAAYLDGADSVGIPQVESAVEELGWEPFSLRRRRARLAMPGVGPLERWRAEIADRLERGAAIVVRSAQATVAALRSRMPAGARDFAHRCLSAMSLDRGRLRAWREAGRDAARGLWHNIPDVVPRLRAWARDQAWVRANLPRAAVVGFIGLLTAGVVVSSNQVGAPLRETPHVASSTGLASQLVVLPGNSRASKAEGAATSQPVAPGEAALAADPLPQIEIRPAKYFGDARSSASDDRPVDSAAPEAEATAPDDTPPVVAAAQPTVTAPHAPEPPADGLADAGWLLEQDAGQYVVQVFAARDREGVQRFVANGTGGLELAYYRRFRDDQEWHVLVAGPYPSFSSAEKASQQFPASVRRARPWIRPLANVHDDIRSGHGQRQAQVLH